MRTGPWHCFHCDELIKTYEEAGLHFGHRDGAQPLCLIKAAGEYALIDALRQCEEELAGYHNEDSCIIRAMASVASDYSAQVRSSEEKGFDRGVRDMRKQYQLLLDELHHHFGCDTECEKRHLHTVAT